MLYEVFSQVLSMSLTAAVMILAVLLVRPVLRRTPRFLSFLLWGAVLFRLACPVSFSAEFSLLRGFDTVDSRIQYVPESLVPSHTVLRDVPFGGTLTPEQYASFTTPHSLFELAFSAAAWIWLAGIGIFLLVNLISLLRLRHRCVGAVRLEGNVWLADGIHTPFVLGVLRPQIYLPSTLSEAERECVLRHERAHIGRLDPLWKGIAFLALAVHWFNPIVWLGFTLFVRDMESACDERVLKDMDSAARADYAETLLNIAAGRRAPVVPIAFTEGSPRSRIKGILRYKKPTILAVSLTALVVIVLGVVLLANPKAQTVPAGQAIEEFPGSIPGNISEESVSIVLGGDSVLLDSPESAAAIHAFLCNMSVSAKEIDRSRAEDRDRTNTVGFGKDGTRIHFSKDFSKVWVDNGVKPSYTYAVTDPKRIRDALYAVLKPDAIALLPLAIQARHQMDSYALYCPKATKEGGSIQVGDLSGTYISDYLLSADWKETRAPRESLPSPESVEFVIREELRVQIWKRSGFVRVRDGEQDFWFRAGKADYEKAVKLVREHAE